MSRSTASARSTTDRTTHSISLNGSSNYVLSFETVPYVTLNKVYSIEFWVKGSSQASKEVFAWDRSSGNALLQIGSNAGGTKLNLFYRNDAGTTLLNNVASTTTVFDGNWHHVVVSDSAGTVNVYIDGALDSTNFNYTVSGTFATLNRSSIGAAYTSSAANFFSGKIAQFRLYNIALNLTQVANAKSNSGSMPRSNLVHEFNFPASGSVAANSGNSGIAWNIVSGTASTDIPINKFVATRSAASARSHA